MKICSIYNVRKIKTTNTNWLYANSERLTVRKKLTFLADEGCSTVIIIKTVWQQNAAVIHSHCCQCSSVEGRRHFVNLELPTIPLSSLDPASKVITQTAVTQKEITLEGQSRLLAKAVPATSRLRAKAAPATFSFPVCSLLIPIF